MSRLLLIAFDESDLNSCGGFAAKLGLPYDALLLSGSSAVGGEKIFQAGLAEIPTADTIAGLLAVFVHTYSHVAFVSSMRSKDLAARIAGILDAAMITDAIGIESPTTFLRPMVAGAVIATVDAEPPVFITFRPSNFAAAELTAGTVVPMGMELAPCSKIVKASAKTAGRPDLSQAKIIVSGGKPLKDAATFESVLGGLADALGGAVGATRAAVDTGIAPNELQVGQTGKIVAPNLYIAAGISGSTQHMAGIKDSKVIVAINKDGDAPIFEVADIGIVADLFDVLPQLQAKLPGARS